MALCDSLQTARNSSCSLIALTLPHLFKPVSFCLTSPPISGLYLSVMDTLGLHYTTQASELDELSSKLASQGGKDEWQQVEISAQALANSLRVRSEDGQSLQSVLCPRARQDPILSDQSTLTPSWARRNFHRRSLAYCS